MHRAGVPGEREGDDLFPLQRVLGSSIVNARINDVERVKTGQQ